MIRNLLLALAMCVCLQSGAWQTLNLQGRWHVKAQSAVDDDFAINNHTALLPGSNLTNSIGYEPSLKTRWTGSIYDSSFYYNPSMQRYRDAQPVKFPFFLTPNKHFVGHLVYSTTLKVPREWQGMAVQLFLERPHIETTVTIDGEVAGHFASLSVPHVYDITPLVKFGSTQELCIDVYNGIENVGVGQDSHSVSDQTQGNWNGIVGRIELVALPKAACKAFAQRHMLPQPRVYAHLESGNVEVVFPDTTCRLHISNPVAWSEFSPVVYHRMVNYHGTSIPITFGFRDIQTRGLDFYLNGKPIWIRGTVENCDFPLTGYPPTDVQSWVNIFKKLKAYGLNAMRFHSYCPPEAAFVAADSMGVYLQPEGPSWPNHGVKLGFGQNIDRYLMAESRRIIDTYGNHPSFIMMAACNEPAGRWVEYCNQWVDSMKLYDARRLYCGASVGGGWAWDAGSQYHVKAGARGLNWDRSAPQSTDNYRDGILYPRNYKLKQPNNSPIVAHEQGQWCAFPDLNERSQYTGVYRAYNFDVFADLLRQNGMASMARKFLMSSGRLQTLAYKFETERNLRTPGYAGFLYLGLNDYSGQGTALVGPLNVFWREKGYVDSTGWREFCNPVVLMAEFPKFTFLKDEKASIAVDFYNATPNPCTTATLHYRMETNGMVLDTGCINTSMPVGKTLQAARIPLATHVSQPCKITLWLNARVNGVNYQNHYDYWVYMPFKDERLKGIYLTDTLDAKALRVLRKGGKVLVAAADKVRYGSDVKQYYLPVFWNTSWFKMRPPHTTGAYIDSTHPLFNDFPTDDWSNLNWWELLNHAQVMNLAEFPASYQSPVQPIDTWHVSRKLGMVAEANVLNGKLLITTMDIASNLDTRIVARQMRHAIISYMKSDNFKPAISVQPQVIADLFEKSAPAVNMYTKDSPDELKPKLTH